MNSNLHTREIKVRLNEAQYDMARGMAHLADVPLAVLLRNLAMERARQLALSGVHSERNPLLNEVPRRD